MRAAALVAAGALLMMPGLAAQARGQTARAELRNPYGEVIGTATFTQESDGVSVTVKMSKLPPGPHGFHVHAVGRCDRPGFTSAGGHFNPAGRPHPHHAGDLPVLLVNADGTAAMTVKTDRFKVGDLFGADGSALVVHAAPDNYANIPKDRYRPSPDAATLATGDAGSRIACGVITR